MTNLVEVMEGSVNSVQTSAMDVVSAAQAERFSHRIWAIHRTSSFTELAAAVKVRPCDGSLEWESGGARQHADIRWVQLADKLAIRTKEARVLTARETGVLRGIAQGLTDAEIARSLTIARRTVCKHVEAIYRKLGVETRTAAAQVYLRWS